MSNKDIESLKVFWNGPKVGFDEKLYQKYLDEKKDYKKKVNNHWKIKMN